MFQCGRCPFSNPLGAPLLILVEVVAGGFDALGRALKRLKVGHISDLRKIGWEDEQTARLVCIDAIYDHVMIIVLIILHVALDMMVFAGCRHVLMVQEEV